MRQTQEVVKLTRRGNHEILMIRKQKDHRSGWSFCLIFLSAYIT